MTLPAEVRRLAGADMDAAPSVADAWLRVGPDGLIEAVGPMSSFDASAQAGHEIVVARGGFVLPAFADSHTHIVYAGSRDGEFLDKIRGLSYEEIARRGGEIGRAHV